MINNSAPETRQWSEIRRWGTAAWLALACGACSTEPPSTMPMGSAAYSAIPVTVTDRTAGLIEVGDRLSIKVLDEPELTSDQYLVDAAGKIEMPLAGDIGVAGRTVEAVRDEIGRRLGRHYIRDPQVTVSLAQSHKAVFTVEGQVREPGRYEAASDMSLLGAIALAKGTAINAKLDEVIVMREAGNQHLGARFNLDAIRLGRTPDPQVIAGDKIVVGYSARKGAWHDFLQAAPLFNIFYVLKR
jgi:polysaccharide export outer membrane protein